MMVRVRRGGAGCPASVTGAEPSTTSSAQAPEKLFTKFSTAVVEAQDWAAGTSSRSSKLVHGGLRYLQMLDFKLVMEALSERDLLLTRLVECKTFKDVAVALQRLAGEAGRSHPRVAGPDERYLELTPDLLAGVTAADLRAAFLRASAPKPLVRIN